MKEHFICGPKTQGKNTWNYKDNFKINITLSKFLKPNFENTDSEGLC